VTLSEGGCQLDEVLSELERRLILQALDRSESVRANAARLLGVSLRSLRYRMQKLAIGDDVDSEPESSPPPDAPDA
jgi:two-component system response regulator PilR (NtrC family)